MSITLCSSRPEDEKFLRHLYASTRLEEKSLLGWDPASWEAFIAMQFAAQQRSYRMHFPDADAQVVLLNDRPIGRLLVDRHQEEDVIRIVDIALLPRFRGLGIGAALVRDLLAEAEAVAKPIRCHVKRHGRERRFWERMGFNMIGDGPVHILMEWMPGTPEPPSPPVKLGASPIDD